MPVREAAPVTSGSGDPVGQQPESVQRLLDRYHRAGIHRLLDRYHSAGIHNTTADFYPGGRHEMLNETNRVEVREHLLAWIAATLRRSPQSSYRFRRS